MLKVPARSTTSNSQLHKCELYMSFVGNYFCTSSLLTHLLCVKTALTPGITDVLILVMLGVVHRIMHCSLMFKLCEDAFEHVGNW